MECVKIDKELERSRIKVGPEIDQNVAGMKAGRARVREIFEGRSEIDPYQGRTTGDMLRWGTKKASIILAPQKPSYTY